MLSANGIGKRQESLQDTGKPGPTYPPCHDLDVDRHPSIELQTQTNPERQAVPDPFKTLAVQMAVARPKKYYKWKCL